MAAIALIRLYHYTSDASYRDKAEQTLETFAGVAEQFGIFAATYGIAALHFLDPATQVVVVAAEDDKDTADELYETSVAAFAFNKATIRLTASRPSPKSSARARRNDSEPAATERRQIFRGSLLRLNLQAADICCGRSPGCARDSRANQYQTLN